LANLRPLVPWIDVMGYVRNELDKYGVLSRSGYHREIDEDELEITLSALTIEGNETKIELTEDGVALVSGQDKYSFNRFLDLKVGRSRITEISPLELEEALIAWANTWFDKLNESAGEMNPVYSKRFWIKFLMDEVPKAYSGTNNRINTADVAMKVDLAISANLSDDLPSADYDKVLSVFHEAVEHFKGELDELSII